MALQSRVPLQRADWEIGCIKTVAKYPRDLNLECQIKAYIVNTNWGRGRPVAHGDTRELTPFNHKHLYWCTFRHGISTLVTLTPECCARTGPINMGAVRLRFRIPCLKHRFTLFTIKKTLLRYRASQMSHNTFIFTEISDHLVYFVYQKKKNILLSITGLVIT